MSFIQTTEELAELLAQLLEDVPKAMKGNKTAAQRIRTKSVKFSKLAKIWRKESLDQERKKSQKKKKSSTKKKS
jgi:hypothetical protein